MQSSEGEVDCYVCNGVGRWIFGITSEPDPVPPGPEILNIDKICGYCGGAGEVAVGGETPSVIACPLCNGEGKYIWAIMEKQE